MLGHKGMLRRGLLAGMAAALAALGVQAPAIGQGGTTLLRPREAIPNPVLELKGLELYKAGGKNWVRYRYDVVNKTAYPDTLFAPSPTLPPCGSNTNSSRSWLDFYGEDGKRLYGFCALKNSESLGSIWFAVEQGAAPPSAVYAVITDRLTNIKYKSNLAKTTLYYLDTPPPSTGRPK